MGLKKIYHLHIPRTSGTNILDAVSEAAENQPPDARQALLIYPAGNFEVLFDAQKVSKYSFISGHFATNPMVQLKDLVVFSLVREPISQYISCAAYRCTSTDREFTHDELERYVLGYYDVPNSFPGFSGFPNSQSHFLSAELARLDEFNEMYHSNEQSSFFFGSPKSLEDVKPYVDEMLIGTLENRGLLLEKVNIIMNQEFGVAVKNDKRKVNNNPDIGFKVSRRVLKLIEEKTWLDLEVYNYVKTKER